MADRLARWISILFDSSILSLPIFFTFGWLSPGAAGLAWAGLTLLIVTGIPLAYLTLGKRLGWVRSLAHRRCWLFLACRWWPGRGGIVVSTTSRNWLPARWLAR